MITTRDFAATTFIVHKHCTLLLLHRKLNIWVPPGGHIDPHELPHEAAVREVCEETGLEVELLAKSDWLGTVQVLPQPHCILLENISDNHQHIDFIYFGYVSGGQLSYEKREAQEARWYSWDDLANPEIAEDMRVLGRRAIESYQ
ncbi:MAG: NUDIX domain-containing protein [Chloroflexota bacterium]